MCRRESSSWSSWSPTHRTPGQWKRSGRPEVLVLVQGPVSSHPGPMGLWCAGEWRYMDSTQAWIPRGYLRKHPFSRPVFARAMKKSDDPEMAVYGMAAGVQKAGCQLWPLDGFLGSTSDATQTVFCPRGICRLSPLPVGPACLCLAPEIDVYFKKKRVLSEQSSYGWF